ncbi:hypothetical protein niasHS_000930 [Heterodera schachtii]|uniref:Uncharacterized protein n=1 Tax=Heterodera schachtii TaxID=97005 RepID=A0ABD2K7R7_HETSC
MPMFKMNRAISMALLLIAAAYSAAFAHPIHNGGPTTVIDGTKLLLVPSSANFAKVMMANEGTATKHFAYSPRQIGGEALFFRTAKASPQSASSSARIFPYPQPSFAFQNDGELMKNHRFARDVAAADGSNEVFVRSAGGGAVKFAFAKRGGGTFAARANRWNDESAATQGGQLFAVEPIEWSPLSSEFAKRGNFA